MTMSSRSVRERNLAHRWGEQISFQKRSIELCAQPRLNVYWPVIPSVSLISAVSPLISNVVPKALTRQPSPKNITCSRTRRARASRACRETDCLRTRRAQRAGLAMLSTDWLDGDRLQFFPALEGRNRASQAMGWSIYECRGYVVDEVPRS